MRGRLKLWLALAAAVPACRYSVDPNSGKFRCASDGDCGGGWHCFASCPVADFSAYCVQNGSCDPCPSLQSDPANCGSCGTACAAGEGCVEGHCVPTISYPDSGVDAGPADAGPDAGGDAGPADGGPDAGPDAGLPDGSVDAGMSDAGPDGGLDAGAPGDGGDGGPADGGDGGVDAGDGGAV
ncbi:MAG: hypothetical protein ACYDCL_14355 [Myxococcales bacterium]